MGTISWLLATWLVAGAAAAEPLPSNCDRPVRATELALVLDEAQGAWVALEVADFVAHTERATSLVPCVREELVPPVIARLHRFEGLRGFVAEDPTYAEAAFAAARAIEPRYHFPSTVVPEGNPVIDVYENVNVARSERIDIPRPASGSIRLDGQLATERYPDWPVAVQLFDKSGAVELSAYVRPGEPLPAYDAAKGPATGGRGLAGPVVSGAVVLVGVGILAVGLNTASDYHARYNEGTFTDLEQAEGMRDKANTFTKAGSAVAGVGAVGLGLTIALGGR